MSTQNFSYFTNNEATDTTNSAQEETVNEQNSMDDRHHGSHHSLTSPEDEKQLNETTSDTRNEFANTGSSII